MKGSGHGDIAHFCIAGINYKKTDAALRGDFAVNSDQYQALLALAPSYGLHDVFILSTCNRTEIYGLTDDVDQLVALLCTQTCGTAATFTQMAYIKKGAAAVDHLFSVAAGLDSQILGDYEIVGQLKQSVKFAREHGFIGTLLEKLVNSVLQSSKAIKNKTGLSGGTVSVSFAAVQYIREQMPNFASKKIVVLGTGKIGRNTCKNMVDYLSTTNITLINRTAEKAAHLANELGLKHAPMAELDQAIADADIILVATNATDPTVHVHQLAHCGKKLIIDLSIPYNVEVAAGRLANIQLVNVDDLSKLKDETLQKRKSEIPRAKAIIDTYAADFAAWCDMRRHVTVLKAVKDKLQQLHTFQTPAALLTTEPLADIIDQKHEARIQKVITTMAVKMRHHNRRGCHYIEAINDFMATGTN